MTEQGEPYYVSDAGGGKKVCVRQAIQSRIVALCDNHALAESVCKALNDGELEDITDHPEGNDD